MKARVISIAMVVALLVTAIGVPLGSAQTLSPWTTGVDIQNLTATQASFIVDFYNAAGTLVYTYTPASPLAARGGANLYVPTIPEANLAAGQYSAIVNASEAVAAVASLQSYGNNPQFGGADIYLGTSAPANELTFPLVYRNHTVRRWYSTIVVQNAAGAAQDVTLTTYNSGQSTPAGTRTVNIAPYASYSFNLETDSNFAGFGPYGSAKATGSAPLAGVASNLTKGRMTDPNTNYLDTMVTEYRGFASGQFGLDVVAPLTYRNYNLWTTGINVVNTTGTATSVTITYKNANPAVTGGPWSVTRTLAGNSMQSFYSGDADIVAAGVPDGFYGSATIHSTVSNVAVVVASQRYRPTGAEGVAYEASKPTDATSCASLPVTHNRTTWKTGINLLNMGNADAVFTLNYYSSAAGVPNAMGQTYTVPANSPFTVYMPGNPQTPAVTQVGFYGAVDIHSTQPFLVNVANSRVDAYSRGVASTYVGVNYACP